MDTGRYGSKIEYDDKRLCQNWKLFQTYQDLSKLRRCLIWIFASYYLMNHSENNLTNSIISLGGNSNEETEKLKLIIAHKDELLAHKEEIIENQKRELALLREMLDALKAK